uniref:Uncharacterized protein n=1 Tax=Manihot esculenta TaxID=3983 RepID=A0A2C9UA46_MANES
MPVKTAAYNAVTAITFSSRQILSSIFNLFCNYIWM